MKDRFLSAKHFLFLILLTCLQTGIWAQSDNGGGGSPSKTEVNITTDGDWYTSPWVWVIGAAIFILLLVALTTGGRRRSEGRTEKTTVTKTVRRDADV